jgi:hypothetical protein
MNFKESSRKYKKYMVMYNNKWIHFGDTRYQHYKDQTPNKCYKNLDHGDLTRRKSYLARAKGIKDKSGSLTYRNKNSANYYSIKYLW